MVQNVCPLVNLILGALSSEFHSTSSTSESPQKKEQWEKSKKQHSKSLTCCFDALTLKKWKNSSVRKLA